ncbi:hypothetical protein BGY98DRAFT_935108 [Russula aff. rugulosa BPL654]|nr:hypothetical protein BGY98DRAFT_935108 [Russula aff. rugulosa BPL654]
MSCPVLTRVPMTMPIRRPRPLSPTCLHKILELLLMYYLVSLSQPHNSASVLELSRSLEFEHEVRRGKVPDADERWKMDVEKVVCQVGLGIPRQYKTPLSNIIVALAKFLMDNYHTFWIAK